LGQGWEGSLKVQTRKTNISGQKKLTRVYYYKFKKYLILKIHLKII